MSRALARHASKVSALTAGSRVLGLVREQVFFALFGAGSSHLSDAFHTANRIPNLFRDLFAEGALTAAFVPTFAQVAEKHGEERAWRLGRAVATAVLCVVGVMCAAGILFAPPVVRFMAPGFAEALGKTALTIQLTRVLWPFLLFASLAAVWAGMLNSRSRFSAPAAAPMMLSVAALGIGVPLAYILDPAFGTRSILGFAIGVLCGGFLQWAAQMRPLRREGFRFRPRLALSDPDLHRVLALMVPAVVGVSATLINVTVNTRFATSWNGAVAWLYGAFRLVQLPIGVFGVAVATVAIPSLSRDTAREDLAGFRSLLGRSLRLVLVLCLPSAVGLMILARPLVSVIYGHGRFDANDVTQVADWAGGLRGHQGAGSSALRPRGHPTTRRRKRVFDRRQPWTELDAGGSSGVWTPRPCDERRRRCVDELCTASPRDASLSGVVLAARVRCSGRPHRARDGRHGSRVLGRASWS